VKNGDYSFTLGYTAIGVLMGFSMMGSNFSWGGNIIISITVKVRETRVSDVATDLIPALIILFLSTPVFSLLVVSSSLFKSRPREFHVSLQFVSSLPGMNK
jgi:hypothetical protein